METTLSGKFTEFTASVSHAAEYGGNLTSLIDGANTHFLIQDVLVDLPGRDSVNDFLAHDGNNKQLTVFESESLNLNTAQCVDCSPVYSMGATLSSAIPAQTGVRHQLTPQENHATFAFIKVRSEEHTSELQSRPHLVCRLLLEKKKNKTIKKQ